MRKLTEREHKTRHEAAAKIASQLSNETLSHYLDMIAERAQRFTAYERQAMIKEAGKRIKDYNENCL